MRYKILLTVGEALFAPLDSAAMYQQLKVAGICIQAIKQEVTLVVIATFEMLKDVANYVLSFKESVKPHSWI